MKAFSVLMMLCGLAAADVLLLARTSPPEEEEEKPAAPPRPAAVPREMRERLQQPKHLPQAVYRSSEPQPTGESAILPDHIRSLVLADASRRTGVKSEGLAILESTAVTWPDGSLGCPERGIRYTQLPRPGYRVVIGANETTYDYRVAIPAPPPAVPAGSSPPAATAQAIDIRFCDPAQRLDPLGPR